jgi:Polysulphide reductase, NrfD
MTNTYYDVPLLKAPVWTWEVPVYFFVGGAAGGAAIIANVARWSGANGTLARDARWIAAAGAPLSAALLTADLGRPERFINMMRVFKPQSAMSVGSWTLAAFSASSTAAVLPVRAVAASGTVASGLLGCGMLTYTGVLIGATAIPVWHEHVGTLPIHFAASGMASATALLTLMGHDEPALNRIALGAAAVETAIGASIELDGSTASAPLRSGPSGWVIRTGGVLSGPVPLICRAAGGSRLRRVASVAALAGSLLTRIGWILAGRTSAEARVTLRSRSETAEISEATEKAEGSTTEQAEIAE